MDEWEEHELNGHLISGDYSIYDNGGIWYLDVKEDYMGFVPVGQFKSLADAKKAAGAMPDFAAKRSKTLDNGIDAIIKANITE